MPIDGSGPFGSGLKMEESCLEQAKSENNISEKDVSVPEIKIKINGMSEKRQLQACNEEHLILPESHDYGVAATAMLSKDLPEG